MADDIVNIVHAGLILVQLFAETAHVAVVASVESTEVASVGELSVNDGVLRVHVGLVEIIGMFHVSATQTYMEQRKGCNHQFLTDFFVLFVILFADDIITSLNSNGSVGTNQHGNDTCTGGRAGSAGSVESQVTGNNDSLAAVPGGRFNPVDSIGERVETTVASIGGINAFNLGVSVLHKQGHQGGLDSLGLVNDSLGTNFKTTNVIVGDIVLFHQVLDSCLERD